MWPFTRRTKGSLSGKKSFIDLVKLIEMDCPPDHDKCMCRDCPKRDKCSVEKEQRDRGCIITVRGMTLPIIVTCCSYRASADSGGKELSGYEVTILDTLLGWDTIERLDAQRRREEIEKRESKEMKRGRQ